MPVTSIQLSPLELRYTNIAQRIFLNATVHLGTVCTSSIYLYENCLHENEKSSAII